MHAAELAAQLVAIGSETYGDFFWQRTDDPYVVFVAEYFLRRSNRTTVGRYLARFLERYPDATTLAAAEPEAVAGHAHWAGMRKRTMRLPMAVAEFAALRRPTAASLELIPHVGAYAAQAIALYAFNERTFPVDGNVTRVVSRYLDLVGGADVSSAADALAVEAESLGGPGAIKRAHAGALSVGWETCRVRRRCAGCRLVSLCRGAHLDAPPGGP